MRKSEGTVEVLPSGRARVRFCFGDGRPKTVSVSGKGRTFANEAEAEAYRAEMAGMLICNGAPSTLLGKYGETVIDARELDGDTTDADNERSRWRTHVVADDIGNMAIGEPQSLDVRDWLKRLKRKGLARSTRIHCLNLMRAVMHEAFERELHEGPNPCVGIRLKKDKRTDEPWTFLLPEEQDALVAATPAPLDCLVDFALGAGLRAGELVTLRLEDVHLDAEPPYITVRYGGLPTPDYPQGQPTKSGKPRDVPLFGRALAAIKRWLSQLDGYLAGAPRSGGAEFVRNCPLSMTYREIIDAAAAVGITLTKGAVTSEWYMMRQRRGKRAGRKAKTNAPRNPNPLGLVFPGQKGAYRSPNHVIPWSLWKGSPQKGEPGDRSFHRATVGILTRAGVARNVRWHDLRHTCATSLLNGWCGRAWEIAEVCAMLGHASVKTTADRYAHVSDTILNRAARETIAAQAREFAEALVVPPAAAAAFHVTSTAPTGPSEILNENAGAGHRSRTGDLRLGKTELSTIVSTGCGPRGKSRGRDSRELLEAAAAGDAVRTLALAGDLARAIVAAPEVALALRVLAGGEHAIAAGIELARMLNAGEELAGVGT